MIEWITILYAIIMEAIVITRPDLVVSDRLPFLKRKTVWVLVIAAGMLGLSISYLVFQFIWIATDSQPIKFCGAVLLIISGISLLMSSNSPTKRKWLILWRQVDAGVCFACLTIIAYAKLKGW